MKKISLQSSFLFLMLLIVLSACKKQTYTLEYNPTIGDKFEQTMAVVLDVKQMIQGQEMNTSIDMKMGVQFTVKDKIDSIFLIDFEFKSMEMTMGMGEGMGAMTFNVTSNTTDEVATPENMNPMFRAMTGVPLEMQFTRTGQIVSVTGYEKLFEAMMVPIDKQINPEVQAQMSQMIQQNFNDEKLTDIFKQISANYPAHPVAKGDKWKIQQDVENSGLIISSDIEMTLKEVKGNVATIQTKNIFKSGENDAVQMENEIPFKMKMSGTQNGTMKVDLTTGWPIESEVDQLMDNEIEMSGMKINQKIEGKVTLK